jgi:hypothetical protein
VRALIERVCTPKQTEVMKLKASGAGNHRMARLLGISITSVKERLTSAERKIFCPEPGCPQLLRVEDDAPLIARCPMHGPMRELPA